MVLEGEPKMEYKLYASGSIVNLGVHRMPEFRNNIFYDLQPKDRIALWVVMKPPVIEPVCGMAYLQNTHTKAKITFFVQRAV